MRGWRHKLALLGTLAFAAIGCHSPNISVRPPKQPEEIVVPPVAETRFSRPPVYPEPTDHNNDPTRMARGRGGPGVPPGGMGGMGPMGGGMGGMGGGMGGMGGMMGMMGMNGNGGYGR